MLRDLYLFSVSQHGVGWGAGVGVSTPFHRLLMLYPESVFNVNSTKDFIKQREKQDLTKTRKFTNCI